MTHAYACGTPVRQNIVRATAQSIKAVFHPEANPLYRGGNAIVWGLIRGAPELIQKIRADGHDYWHMDNGYFGRGTFFRITKNANQRTDLIDRPHDRWLAIKKQFDLKTRPWTKGSKILVVQSTPWLYKFMGTDIDTWTQETVRTIKNHTDREIVIRPKPTKNSKLLPIEAVLNDVHALVTHTSAAALDALRAGVPVFTTGECCAKPLSGNLEDIENPVYPEREPLFWHLSYCMFSGAELQSGMWKEYACYESS